MLKLPTTHRLHQLLCFNKKKGILTRRIAVSNVRAGSLVKGHRIHIDGIKYPVSRVIWKMVTGRDPKNKEIDHRNRNRRDNRWSNLRLANRLQNVWNTIQPIGISGKTGIRKRGDSWQVCISYRKKRKYLGTFDSLSKAAAMRNTANRKLYGEFVPR